MYGKFDFGNEKKFTPQVEVTLWYFFLKFLVSTSMATKTNSGSF